MLGNGNSTRPVYSALHKHTEGTNRLAHTAGMNASAGCGAGGRSWRAPMMAKTCNHQHRPVYIYCTLAEMINFRTNVQMCTQHIVRAHSHTHTNTRAYQLTRAKCECHCQCERCAGMTVLRYCGCIMKNAQLHTVYIKYMQLSHQLQFYVYTPERRAYSTLPAPRIRAFVLELENWMSLGHSGPEPNRVNRRLAERAIRVNAYCISV